MVGAIGESSGATGVNGNQADESQGGSGAAYVFTRSAGSWSQQAYLKQSNNGIGGSPGVRDYFGFNLAIAGDAIVVGAVSEPGGSTGVNGDQTDASRSQSGAAYLFTGKAGVWSQAAYLKASNTDAEDFFGYDVAISADAIAVGAQYEDSHATGIGGDQADNTASGSGAVYLFDRHGLVP